MGNTQTKKSFGSASDSNNPRPGYYKNTSEVRYGGDVIVSGNEVKSFVKLKHSYAKTDKQVFYKGIPILSPTLDIPTFEVFNREQIKSITTNPYIINKNSVIGKDKNNYYYRGKVLVVE